jgi:hypothetical protein
VAKARVDLKGVKKTAAQLAKDLKKLRKTTQPASQRDADAVHERLTTIKALIDDCPEGLFRMFEIAAPGTRPARKAVRKGTRKKVR